jgi:hypothetical protein
MSAESVIALNGIVVQSWDWRNSHLLMGTINVLPLEIKRFQNPAAECVSEPALLELIELHFVRASSLMGPIRKI